MKKLDKRRERRAQRKALDADNTKKVAGKLKFHMSFKSKKRHEGKTYTTPVGKSVVRTAIVKADKKRDESKRTITRLQFHSKRVPKTAYGMSFKQTQKRLLVEQHNASYAGTKVSRHETIEYDRQSLVA